MLLAFTGAGRSDGTVAATEAFLVVIREVSIAQVVKNRTVRIG